MTTFSLPLRAREPESHPRIIPPEEHREFLEEAEKGELVRPAPAREQRLMVAQIPEDFRRLQSINAERIRPSITTGVFDYAKIAKAASGLGGIGEAKGFSDFMSQASIFYLRAKPY